MNKKISTKSPAVNATKELLSAKDMLYQDFLMQQKAASNSCILELESIAKEFFTHCALGYDKKTTSSDQFIANMKKTGASISSILKDYSSDQVKFILNHFWLSTLSLVKEHVSKKEGVGLFLISSSNKYPSPDSIGYRDINYLLKEVFSWCVLYPSQVDAIFSLKNGVIERVVPKVGVFDQNVKITEKKEPNAGIEYIKTVDKKAKTQSGLSQDCAKEVLTYFVVGFFVQTSDLQEKLGIKKLKQEFSYEKKLKQEFSYEKKPITKKDKTASVVAKKSTTKKIK